MDDEQLESLIRAADESAGGPADLSPDLADRVRKVHARIRLRTTRVKLAVSLVGCYAAGMLTTWTVFGLANPEMADVAEHVSSPSRLPVPREDAPRTLRHGQEVPKQVTEPRMVPLEPALVAETSRYELLRQMGDESQRRGDLQAAVAYYGQALDVATHAERTIVYEQDNWLLISLKKDRVASLDSPAQGDSI